MLLIFDRNFVGSPDPMTEEQRLEAFGYVLTVKYMFPLKKLKFSTSISRRISRRFYHGEPILNIALDLKIPYIRLVSTLHVVRSTLHCRNIPLDVRSLLPSTHAFSFCRKL